MLAQAKARLLAKLTEIDASLRKRPAKPETIERRVGRWQGRHSQAERYYQVEIRTEEFEVRPDAGSRLAKTEIRATGLEIAEKEVPMTWPDFRDSPALQNLKLYGASSRFSGRIAKVGLGWRGGDGRATNAKRREIRNRPFRVDSSLPPLRRSQRQDGWFRNDASARLDADACGGCGPRIRNRRGLERNVEAPAQDPPRSAAPLCQGLAVRDHPETDLGRSATGDE